VAGSVGWKVEDEKGRLVLRPAGEKNQNQEGQLFGLFLAERKTNEWGGCLGFSGFSWRRDRLLG
jgi:hypothetical protein